MEPIEPSEPPVPGVTVEPNGNLTINVSTVEEARLAIKQLRLHKRERQLQRKEIVEAQKVTRTDRRTEVARQGSKVRGGGNAGKFVRSAQTIGRDTDRHRHAGEMATFDEQKAQVDAIIMRIDAAILQLDQLILTDK